MAASPSTPEGPTLQYDDLFIRRKIVQLKERKAVVLRRVDTEDRAELANSVHGGDGRSVARAPRDTRP